MKVQNSIYNKKSVKIICFESPVPFRRVALAYRKSAVKKEAINAIVGVIKSLDLSKLYI